MPQVLDGLVDLEVCGELGVAALLDRVDAPGGAVGEGERDQPRTREDRPLGLLPPPPLPRPLLQRVVLQHFHDQRLARVLLQPLSILSIFIRLFDRSIDRSFV